MKRLYLTLMLVVGLLLATVSPAFAGGDKVRGDGGARVGHPGPGDESAAVPAIAGMGIGRG